MNTQIINTFTGSLRRVSKRLFYQYSQYIPIFQIKYKFILEEGKNAGHHLKELAEKQKVGMIVIGTRGQGTIRRTILGSVSEYLVHHAHVPVTVCSLHKKVDLPPVKVDLPPVKVEQNAGEDQHF